MLWRFKNTEKVCNIQIMRIKVDKINEIKYVVNYLKKEQTFTINRYLIINIVIKNNIPFAMQQEMKW